MSWARFDLGAGPSASAIDSARAWSADDRSVGTGGILGHMPASVGPSIQRYGAANPGALGPVLAPCLEIRST